MVARELERELDVMCGWVASAFLDHPEMISAPSDDGVGRPTEGVCEPARTVK
jgi:hypothetical protein